MTLIILGLFLGASAGLAPGPLLALLIERTLQGGLASGIRIAFVPVLSDLPIVLLALLVVGRLPDNTLDVMLLAGGLFVIWLGIDGIRRAGAGIDSSQTTTARQDFLHGVLTNLLNPHPYIFWAAAGAPLVIRAWRTQPGAAVGFVVLFYVMLIGSKVILAAVVSRARSAGMFARRYRLVLQTSSALLVAMGLFMVITAWQHLDSALSPAAMLEWRPSLTVGVRKGDPA